jgi:hypothetical protein
MKNKPDAFKKLVFDILKKNVSCLKSEILLISSIKVLRFAGLGVFAISLRLRPDHDFISHKKNVLRYHLIMKEVECV